MKGFIAWLLEALGTIKEPEQPPRPIDRTGAHNFSAGWVPK